MAARRFRAAAVLAVAGALGVSALAMNVAAPAGAVQVPQDSVVSANPADWTPDVMDGTVESIVEVGDRIVVAGTFTQVKEKGVNKPVLQRSGVFSFNPADGRIDQSFAPKGLSHDGASVGLVRLPVAPGARSVKIDVADTADAEVWTKQWSDTVTFETNRAHVVLFETKAGFTLH